MLPIFTVMPQIQPRGSVYFLGQKWGFYSRGGGYSSGGSEGEKFYILLSKSKPFYGEIFPLLFIKKVNFPFL